MHEDRTTDLNRKTLRRVIALLLALAGLLDRAAGRSRTVRWSVLWLLGPAEPIVRDYVAAVTGGAGLADPPAPLAIGPCGDSPADAHRLAHAFRALAAALAAVLHGLLPAVQIDVALAGLATLARSIARRAHLPPTRAVGRRDSS